MDITWPFARHLVPVTALGLLLMAALLPGTVDSRGLTPTGVPAAHQIASDIDWP